MTEAFKYVELNNPVLRQVSESISENEIGNIETQQLIDRMLGVAFPNQGDKSKPVLVGLAAPQIGVLKRVILVDLKADGRGESGDLRPFINPEIIGESDEKVEGYEGCASTDRVCGIVTRSNEVQVSVNLRNGRKTQLRLSGFPAIIFQHELDHLNGILFPDRVKNDEDLHWVENEKFPEYREGWKTWPYKVSREKWQRLQQT